MRILPRALLGALVSCGVCSPAAAAPPCDNPVASPCIDADTFWPLAGAPHSASVTGASGIRAGLVVSYASRPLVFGLPSPGAGGSDSVAADSLTTATVLLGYAVADSLALDLAVPATVYQTGAGLSSLTGGAALAPVALRDPRVGFTLHLTGPDGLFARHGVLRTGARGAFTLPLGDEAQLAGERGLVWAPSLFVALQTGRWDAGVELGVRARPAAQLPSLRLGSQAVVAAAVGYDLLAQRGLFRISAELRALPSLVSQPPALPGTPGGFVPSEWLATVQSRPTPSSPWGFELAGGGGVPWNGEAAATTPRFRVMVGVRYALGAERSGT